MHTLPGMEMLQTTAFNLIAEALLPTRQSLALLVTSNWQ